MEERVDGRRRDGRGPAVRTTGAYAAGVASPGVLHSGGNESGRLRRQRRSPLPNPMRRDGPAGWPSSRLTLMLGSRYRWRQARYRSPERCQHLLGIGSTEECTWSLPKARRAAVLARVSSANHSVSGRGGEHGSVKFVGQADSGNSEETSAMRLLQRIGEIFGEDFSNSLKRFRVKDSGTKRNKLEVVLLVESPDTDEVSPPGEDNPHEIGNRYPLAGEEARYSGKIVSNKFMEWYPRLGRLDEPIGKLVHDNAPAVNWLGIMNVSQLPFQEGAYEVPDDAVFRNHQCWTDYIECMKYIKKNPGIKTYTCRKRKDECISETRERTQRLQQLRCKINKLEHAIIEDLAGRLEQLRKDMQVMCCGEVAQIFYLKASYYRSRRTNNRYILDFPHPARQNWQNLNPQQNVCLQEILERIRPPQAGA